MTKSIAVKPTRRLRVGTPSVHARHAAADDGDENEANAAFDPLAATHFNLRKPPPRAVPQLRHRFRVGERLSLLGSARVLSRTGVSCRVIALMPYEGSGPLQYRVRSESEQFERVVPEGDLTR